MSCCPHLASATSPQCCSTTSGAGEAAARQWVGLGRGCSAPSCRPHPRPLRSLWLCTYRPPLQPRALHPPCTSTPTLNPPPPTPPPPIPTHPAAAGMPTWRTACPAAGRTRQTPGRHRPRRRPSSERRRPAARPRQRGSLTASGESWPVLTGSGAFWPVLASHSLRWPHHQARIQARIALAFTWHLLVRTRAITALPHPAW